jgi:hypothetical protein
MKNFRSRSAGGGDMDPYSSAARDQCKIGSLLSNARTVVRNKGDALPRIGSIPLPIKAYLLGKPLPGRRQPVKAASREAGARHAPALTGWRCSGPIAASGQGLAVRLTAPILATV